MALECCVKDGTEHFGQRKDMRANLWSGGLIVADLQQRLGGLTDRSLATRSVLGAAQVRIPAGTYPPQHGILAQLVICAYTCAHAHVRCCA